MFGSFFRATVVIGTIYAISPVKLDATPLPSGPQAKGVLTSALETATSPAGSAPRLLAAAVAGAQGQAGQDQIGDLITLGKDLCLANPGLCVEAAKALQDKTVSAPAKPLAKTPPPLKAAEPSKSSDPVRQAEPAKTKQAEAKRPDALAALIEKTVPQTPHALAKPAR